MIRQQTANGDLAHARTHWAYFSFVAPVPDVPSGFVFSRGFVLLRRVVTHFNAASESGPDLWPFIEHKCWQFMNQPRQPVSQPASQFPPPRDGILISD